MYDQKLRLNTIKYCNIWYSSSFIGLVYLPYYICIFFLFFHLTPSHNVKVLWLRNSTERLDINRYLKVLLIVSDMNENRTIIGSKLRLGTNEIRRPESDFCQGLVWSSVITKPRRRKDDLTQAKIKNWFFMYSDRPIKIGPT